jgi:fructose-bisphosphate aldolase, class II
MPLVDMRDLLQHAREHHYAITSFHIRELDSLDRVITAAERCEAPVVLSIDAGQFENGLRPRVLLAAMHAAACETSAPVALYLKGGNDTATIVEAIRRGCNGVHIDADSDQAVSAATRILRDCGVAIGLGPQAPATPESDKVHDVDFLSLSPARGHADRSDARPRVWHDGSDLSAARVMQLIDAGVALIDFPEKDVTVADAEGLIPLCGGAGQAGEALAQCRPWTPVEHVIVYNVEGLDEQGVEAMMATGREQLGAIPGVLGVFTGRALSDNAKYRYCWLVRFTHPAVIKSYAAHPDHVAFADRLFRPVAGERITIDYQAVV